MSEHLSFSDQCNDFVTALESQYLAMLSCEYGYELDNGDDLLADDTYQKTQNELWRLAHPTEPDEQDIQHAAIGGV